MLLIGSWSQANRLNFFGIPLDILVMVSLVLLSTAGIIRKETLKKLVLMQIPLLFLGVSIIWSPLPFVGLDKFTTLLFTSIFAFLLLNTVVEKHGINELVRVILAYLSVLLVLAFTYKLAFGFFNRQVLFFLNGPIVFARFMTIALVIVLFQFRGKLRVVLASIFLLAIIWTASKGPLLAALSSVIAAIFINAEPKMRAKISIWLLIIASLGWLIVKFYVLDRFQLGRLGILFTLATGDFDVSGASGVTIGTRLGFWDKSIALMAKYPFGTGLGSWGFYVETRVNNPYPHNLFMEMLSEGGLIIGALACVPLLLFICAPVGVFWCIALSLFIAQLVSGDIGDARLMYVFSLLACFSTESSALRNYRLPGAMGFNGRSRTN